MIVKTSLDDAEVRALIDQLPRNIFNVERSAVFTTTTFAKKLLQDRMTDKMGIPSRVFRRFRVKRKNSRTAGTVWLGLNDVMASYIGSGLSKKNAEGKFANQDEGGAWAGKYYFAGGFIAEMKSGHIGIFKRGDGMTKNDKVKLIEQGVNLKVGYEIADEVARISEIELRNRFAAKVRELNPAIT